VNWLISHSVAPDLPAEPKKKKRIHGFLRFDAIGRKERNEEMLHSVLISRRSARRKKKEISRFLSARIGKEEEDDATLRSHNSHA